ncbi:hypothetical protein [Beijerinckia mobilis]|uniref:hypothetical protein n=1 Tax=Beijerinckia mobilis TaxID=231434 RepID=UPI00054D4864|nr:hypothetical protein [Beijerinckia mobilis]
MIKISDHGLKAILLLGVLTVGGAALAEGTTTRPRKAKTNSTVAIPTVSVTTDQPPRSGSVPMDFSGMSKRGADLPLDAELRAKRGGATGPGSLSNNNRSLGTSIHF